MNGRWHHIATLEIIEQLRHRYAPKGTVLKKARLEFKVPPLARVQLDLHGKCARHDVRRPLRPPVYRRRQLLNEVKGSMPDAAFRTE